MRYRLLDANGDYVFGQGPAQFLVDVPEAVAQAVGTRLALIVEEWFLDQAEGTPWLQSVLGTGTQQEYDAALQRRILETQGVTSIDSYVSVFDANKRQLTVTASISTIYGETVISQVL